MIESRGLYPGVSKSVTDYLSRGLVTWASQTLLHPFQSSYMAHLCNLPKNIYITWQDYLVKYHLERIAFGIRSIWGLTLSFLILYSLFVCFFCCCSCCCCCCCFFRTCKYVTGCLDPCCCCSWCCLKINVSLIQNVP